MNTRKTRDRNQSVTKRRLKEFASRYGVELEVNAPFQQFTLRRGDDFVFVLHPDTSKPLFQIRSFNRSEWDRIILHNIARMALIQDEK